MTQNGQQHYVQVPYTQFYPNRTMNVDSRYINSLNSLMPASRMRLSLYRVSWKSQFLNGIRWKAIPNLTQIRHEMWSVWGRYSFTTLRNIIMTITELIFTKFRLVSTSSYTELLCWISLQSDTSTAWQRGDGGLPTAVVRNICHSEENPARYYRKCASVFM